MNSNDAMDHQEPCNNFGSLNLTKYLVEFEWKPDSNHNILTHQTTLPTLYFAICNKIIEKL